MPYSIKTKDGITINNIPDDVPPDDESLKQRVSEIRRQRETGGEQAPPTRDELISQIPGVNPNLPAPPPEPSVVDKIIGGGEALLATVTGSTSGTYGTLMGTLQGILDSVRQGKLGTEEGNKIAEQKVQEYARSLTYEPKTASGKEYTQDVARFMSNVAGVAPVMGSPMMRPTLSPAVTSAEAAVRAVPEQFNQIPRPSFGRTSAGAAATPEALRRTTIAENLPVPVSLTKGAASREAAQLSFEKEQMKSPTAGAPLRQRAEENNLQLLQNFDTLIDRTGSTITNPVSVGNSVVSALTKGYTEARNKTRLAYSEAKRSKGASEPISPMKPVEVVIGDEPVTTSVIDYINSQPTGVPATALTDSVRAYMKKLKIAKEDADGNLVPLETTVKNMENLREAVNASGNLNPAEASIIKNIIDSQLTGTGGEAFKRARAFRVEQAKKFENRAVVSRLLETKRRGEDPIVAADKVFEKTILGSSPDEISFIRNTLTSSGPEGVTAWKDLKAATLRYIRDKSSEQVGTDSQGRPIVSTAKLNNIINSLDENGRLDVVFGKKTGQIIRDLNEVSKAINTVPPGTLVNSSNTAQAIIAALTEAGVTAGATGIPVPVLSTIRVAVKGIKDIKLRKRIEDTLKKYEQ